MGTLAVQVPRTLAPLLEPKRYKAVWGGRGGGKSHFMAQQLLLACYTRPHAVRAVCIREVQNSLKESVRQLLVDKIKALDLEDCFDVLENEIRGVKGKPTEGSLIIFKGMQSYNSANLKSMEDMDIAWVEEAQTLSEVSLRLLRPTIRKPGSEIWFSWNPRFDTDPVDHFFRGNDPQKNGKWQVPSNAARVEINWYDNPWLTSEIIEEKDHDYASDPEMAEHVWGGGYETVTAGAYYAKLISEIEKKGQIGNFPHLPGHKVYTGWDLGVDDYTSVWFFQIIEGRVRVVDFFEYQNEGPDTIIPHCMPEYANDVHKILEGMTEIGRDDMFDYQRHFLPHDVKIREWGAGARSRVHALADQGIPISAIKPGVAQPREDAIQAVRKMLPICDFNATGRVQLGLAHLRRYSKKFNEHLGVYMGPRHDEHSHSCLAPHSMVTMADRSLKPIKDIKVGEYVWTPSGSSCVLNAGPVKSVNELIVIETEDGKKLECTPEHKILTNKGFVMASSLNPSMTILTGQEWRTRLIGFISMATGMGLRGIITGEVLGTPGNSPTYTEQYGRQRTARYQMDATYTTKTETPETITCPTLSAWMEANIFGCTHWSELNRVSSSPHLIMLDEKRLSGILLQKVSNGTKRMERLLGKIGSGIRGYAKNAVVSFTRRLLGRGSAIRSVVTMPVGGEKGGTLVYDLTVKRNSLYQAEGLLVSNSDAFSEFAVNCGLVIEKKPEAKKDQYQGMRAPDLNRRAKMRRRA